MASRPSVAGDNYGGNKAKRFRFDPECSLSKL